MAYPKFDEAELKVIGEVPGRRAGFPSIPLYNSPISLKENFLKAVLDKKPMYQLSGLEVQMSSPLVIPDVPARAAAMEARTQSRETFGGPDMFGTEWVYVDVAGGSMVKPGNPRLTDANDWKEVIPFPDVDSWDWDGWYAANKDWIDSRRVFQPCIFTGWYERLISFMDFAGAAVALIDEEQKDAVKELFSALTDVYIKIFDKFRSYTEVLAVNIHDDWGSQRAPFFSLATAREMIVPAMKKFTDYAHSLGVVTEIHSCGKNELLTPAYIEAGWDMWSPQPMNDARMLIDKYGDQIVIGVNDEIVVNEESSLEEQKAAAKEFVDKYCVPGKVVSMGYFAATMPKAMRAELYKLSRIKFAE